MSGCQNLAIWFLCVKIEKNFFFNIHLNNPMEITLAAVLCLGVNKKQRSYSLTNCDPFITNVKMRIKPCSCSKLYSDIYCAVYSVFIETPPKQSGMAGTDGSSNPGKLSLNLSE